MSLIILATAFSRDGKDIGCLLKEFLSIYLLDSTDYEHMAGKITHIQFEGEMHPLNFALHGIMQVKGELMKVSVDSYYIGRKLFLEC
jgi:hypothetical protein